MRRFLGNLFAVVGAAAVVVNVWKPWYRGVPGRRIDVGFLVGREGYLTSELWRSLLVAAAVVGAVAVLGLLVQSRVLFGLAGLCGVAMVVLWVVFRARGFDAGVQAEDFGVGLWSTLGGAVLLWLSAAVLPGRRRAVAGGPR